MFVTVRHLHPSLIFVGKARSLTSNLHPVGGSTRISHCLCENVKVTDSDKPSSWRMTLSITTLCIMILIIRTLNIIALYSTLSISDTLYNSNECHVPLKLSYVLFIVIRSVIILNVVMLSIVVPSSKVHS